MHCFHLTAVNKVRKAKLQRRKLHTIFAMFDKITEFETWCEEFQTFEKSQDLLLLISDFI